MTTTSAPSTLLAWGRATAVIAGAVAGARYLHGLAEAPWTRIDHAALSTWLGTTPPEDVIAALLRVAALLSCWWVVGSFGLAVAGRVVGWRPGLRVIDRVTPRFLRGLADGLMGGSLVVTTFLGAAVPASADPGPHPPGLVPLAPVEMPADGLTDPGVPQPPATPTEVAERAAAGTTGRTSARSHVVRPGDHLWSIAREELGRRRGRPEAELTDREVAAYWRQVVAANQGQLRSTHPDLVFPGEVVVLP